jgi:hypothetical protein
MTGPTRAWWRWRTRRERFIVRSRWLRRVAAERRARAERALRAEPKLAGELVQILSPDQDLGEHFVLGFTARPDPTSPQKRLGDGFAAMALRSGQLRAEALLRRRLELEHAVRRAT